MIADRNRQQSRRSGLTLIELVVSSVLLVLLTSTVFGVLQSSFAETKRVAVESERLPAVSLLEEQLRRDLQNAQGVQAGSNVIRLVGYLATNAESLMPTMTRAFVEYRIVTLGDSAALVRQETPLDNGLGRAIPQSELLWVGASRLELIVLQDATEDEDGLDQPSPDAAGLTPMPPSVRLVLLDSRQQPLTQLTVHHHQDR